MKTDLYAMKKSLGEQGIFFCLSGPISQNILVEIGDTLKQKMAIDETDKSTVLKVFSMLVEQSQNIIHYSAEKIFTGKGYREEPAKEIAMSLGIITVGFEDGHYFVLCGNTVENKDVEYIENKLDRLKTMNKEELKQFYREQRRMEADKSSKGGGIGFVEVARRASKPIEFDFKPIDGNYSFFSLKAVI
jgi:hypothetical protein